MSEYEAYVYMVIIGAITFLATVRISQRYFLAQKKLDVELAQIRVQEQLVNGRSTDDLVEEAKAAERLARAREKEAKALDRIAERRELEAGDG